MFADEGKAEHDRHPCGPAGQKSSRPRAAELIQINDERRAPATIAATTRIRRGAKMGMMTRRIIPGTPVFDGEAASRGYRLNAMCYSFNNAANRAAFLVDEEGYCRKFGLNEAQRRAVADRDVAAMIAAGGNVYYLAKLAGIFGLNVQDIGAQQTGMSLDDFKAMLVEQAA
jgi:protocatechuate 4,5-dioxygenase alpha chain